MNVDLPAPVCPNNKILISFLFGEQFELTFPENIFDFVKFVVNSFTVHFPNFVGKFLPLFVLTGTGLFYIRSKIFLYIRNLWILLFKMIYYWSLIFHRFVAKLAVYEKDLHLT